MAELTKTPVTTHDKTLVTLGKNSVYEIHVRCCTDTKYKDPLGRPKRFIDVRNMWYKDGPTNPPLFTKKGAMVPRDQIPRLIDALLREMDPEEIAEYITPWMDLLAQKG